MLKTYEYYTKFNWTNNPFTLTISPDLMVGFSSQIESLLSHIFNFHKIGILIGPTGSGKTTLLNFINSEIDNRGGRFTSFYISKPPITEDGLVSLFKFYLGYSILDRMKFHDITIMNLAMYIAKKTRKKNVVFLIDEAHECPLSMLEWLRTISDMIPNFHLILAGLPSFEKKIENDLPTLFMRVNTRVYLESLDRAETESLIRKRLSKVGGKELDPFTPESIDKIFDITGGFPREIIKLCDQLVKGATIRNVSSVNGSFVDDFMGVRSDIKTSDLKVYLTPKQEQILRILNENTLLSPSDIIKVMGHQEYKTKNHAIRSVNNILRRLIDEDLLTRTKAGNKYMYSLSGKAKTFFVEA